MSDIVLSITGNSVVEGTAAVFQVTLSAPSASDVEVGFETFGGTADMGAEVAYFNFDRGGTLTIPAGSMSATFDIVTANDTNSESDEDFFVALYNPIGAVFAGGALSIRAYTVIRDNDGTVTADAKRALLVGDVELLEGDGGVRQAAFPLRLSQPATSTIVLGYTTVDGTALAGADYVAQSGQVTFLPGQTETAVMVPLISDGVSEGTEAFSLIVTPGAGITNGVDGAEGIATILDDDASQAVPVISIAAESMLEGLAARFVVTMSAPSASDVEVGFQTFGGTADMGEVAYFNFDRSGILTIPAGSTSVTFDIVTANDTNSESDEDFYVALYNPIGAVLAGEEPTIRAYGVIQDNDGTVTADAKRALLVGDVEVLEGDGGSRQVVFPVRLSQPAASTIVLGYTTVDGTALAGADYVAQSGQVTFLPGQTETAVMVPLISDGVSEGTEAFSLIVTPGAGITNGVEGAEGIATILDDDASQAVPVISIVGESVLEGLAARFVMTMSAPSASDVRVGFETFGGTADLNIDVAYFNFDRSGTVTIPAGSTSVAFDIVTASDTNSESDEDFFVALYNPIGAVLAGEEPTIRAYGVIRDDDGAATTDAKRALLVGDVELLEGDGGSRQAVFPLRLSRPDTSTIVLSYTTVDGTALAGADYVAQSGQVTFLPGQTETAVMVPLISDGVSEGTEAFSLLVTPGAGIANGVNGAEGVATILDDDASQAVPVISIVGESVPEGLAARFVVTMSAPSASVVRVEFETLSGTADLNIDHAYFNFDRSGTLTIPAGSTSTTFDIVTAQDTINEADEDFFVKLYNPVGAVFAGNAPTMLGQGIILDDDGLATADSNRAFFIDDAQVIEGSSPGREAVVTVWLSRPAETIAAISYTTISGSALAGQDFEARSGQLVFQPGQTMAAVAIPILSDLNEELDETFGVIFSSPVNGALGTRTSALVTILDDDSGGEVISGDAGANNLVGGPGNDTISGLGGDDALFGQAGNDLLNGGDGNDVILGNDGNDAIDGGNGNDLITGDLAATPGLGGADIIIGGAGNDTVLCQEGADTVIAGDGNDLIGIFGGQNISIDGGAGTDVIIGGFDAFGAANATLVGGAGSDLLVGGQLNDIFGYQSGFGPSDLIYLFTQGIDKIRLAPNINGSGVSTPAQAAAAASAAFLDNIGPAAAVVLGG